MEPAIFQAYALLVAREFGIQLPKEKMALLESRLQRLLKAGGPAAKYKSAAGFLKALRHDNSGKLLKLLSEAITTHHTYFGREKDHFCFYRDKVLPWLAETIKDGDIRTWCAASSTGQEAYTIAMLLQDQFGLQGDLWEKTLLATDLASDVLHFAQKGIYLRDDVKNLPASWQHGYFHAVDEAHVQVIESLRRQVLFRQFNLMEPVFPFKKPFHVIFCRNVMIYFDAPTRKRLVQMFFDYLVPGGYLFVGHSESVDRSIPYQYVMPSVYRRPLLAKNKIKAGKTAIIKKAYDKIADKVLAKPAQLKSAVKIIALGASTGGTEALATLISGLRPPLPPIVIVQHIPSGFSRLFAERLNRESAFTVKEAAEGDHLEPNHIYVAPGDRQMRVRALGDLLLLSCHGTELVNGHCPSVDVLFDSVAPLGKAAIGVILTGMGADGAKGLLRMRQQGARTLGQNEHSSVVYGMPKAAYELGSVEKQLELSAMPMAIMHLAGHEGGCLH